MKGNHKIQAVDYQPPSKAKTKRPFFLSKMHRLLFALLALCCVFIVLVSLARSIEIKAVSQDVSGAIDDSTGFVKTVPIRADIDLATWLKLPIGNRVLVLPGAHTVKLKAKGYHPITQGIEVGAGRYQSFNVTLEALPGNLDITLKPSIDATVALDGNVFGQLPGLIKEVAAGQHTLTIDAPLYRASTQTITVYGKGATEELSIELEPAWANVDVRSQPDNAQLIVDGKKVGVSPLTLKLEEGLHRLEVTADKFKTHKQEFTLVAQQDLSLPVIILKPSDAELELTTQPAGAAVIVNGDYQGVSPLTLSLKPEAKQKIVVYKAGYKKQTKAYNLTADEHQTASFSLQQDLVSVKFSVTPQSAQLYIDGIKQGSANQTLSLNTMAHQIRISKAGYVDYKVELVPTQKSKQVVSVNLLTKEQHFWANIKNKYVSKAGQTMQLFKSPGLVYMGSSRREAGRRSNEVAYQAKLSKHFYVSEYEVTNQQFREFKPKHNGGNYKSKSLNSPKHPVVNVSWQEAALYCNWLSNKEGLPSFYTIESGFVSGHNAGATGYRLLTEVEWAWLARNKGDGVLTYPWGNGIKPAGRPIGNFADKSAGGIVAFILDGYDDGYAASSPVGKFPANHRGLYDMAGNVSEWVHDWYSAKAGLSTQKKPVLIDPIGPDVGEFHVVRGGSWAKGHLPQLRLAYRDYDAKGRHDIGFRVARYVGPSGVANEQ